MNTEDTTLYIVIANMLLTPFLQYLLHSRCSSVDIGCIHCTRDVLKSKEEKDLEVGQV
jgi:hypothetical protein